MRLPPCLYLDYGKKDGRMGTESFTAAIKTWRRSNFLSISIPLILGRTYPGVVMIAEESTAWPKCDRTSRQMMALDFTL